MMSLFSMSRSLGVWSGEMGSPSNVNLIMFTGIPRVAAKAVMILLRVPVWREIHNTLYIMFISANMHYNGGEGVIKEHLQIIIIM